MDAINIIQALVNIIAIPSAIISIIYLIKQSSQTSKTIKSQVYQGLIENSLKIDELLIQYPEFRKYVYGNEPITEKTKDLDRLMSVMEFVIDVVDNVNAQKELIPTDFRSGWEKYIEELTSSPAAKYFLKTHGHWFSSGMNLPN